MKKLAVLALLLGTFMIAAPAFADSSPTSDVTPTSASPTSTSPTSASSPTTSQTTTSKPSVGATDPSCFKNMLDATWNGRNGVSLKTYTTQCTVQLTTWSIAPDGKQTKFKRVIVTVEQGSQLFTVDAPACGPYQFDARAFGGKFVTGGINQGTPCTTPTGTPTGTPTCRPGSPLPGCHGIPTPSCTHPSSCTHTTQWTAHGGTPVTGTSSTTTAALVTASDQLPRTGINVAKALAYAGSLLFIGATFMFAFRKPKTARH